MEEKIHAPEMDVLFSLTSAYGIGSWLRNPAAWAVADRRLSPRGGHRRPFHAGFRGRPERLAEQLAEVGVILLMFGVGLHFHFKELLAVRRVAVPGAVGPQSGGDRLGCRCRLGVRLGLDRWAHLWAGASPWPALSYSYACLTDHNDLHTPAGHIAVGWLVVEDLFTVLVLVLLPALFGTQATGLSQMPLALGIAASSRLACWWLVPSCWEADSFPGCWPA